MHIRFRLPTFLRACPEQVRGELLEVGAGSGYSSQRILETYPQVELTAIDIDSVATQRFDDLQAKYGRRLNAQQANVLKLPFDRASFDFVVAVNVLWRMSDSDVKEALLQLLRVTRPGGFVGISESSFLFFPWMHQKNIIEQVFVEEGCDILYSNGEWGYDVWIRKPHHQKEVAHTI